MNYNIRRNRNNSSYTFDDLVGLINNYNNVQRLHNLNMIDYNRNIYRLIQLLDSILTLRPENISDQTNDTSERPTTTNRDGMTSIIMQFLSPSLNGTLNDETIPVGLNSQQIEQYTEDLIYDSSMQELRCPISYEDFEIGEQICRIINCGHYFKTESLNRWLQQSTICPVCRMSLIPSSIPTTPSSTNLNSTLMRRLLTSIMQGDISNTSASTDGSNNVMYSFDFPLFPSTP